MKKRVVQKLFVCGLAAMLMIGSVSGVSYAAENGEENSTETESGTESQGEEFSGGFPGGGFPGGPGQQEDTAETLTDTIMDVVLNVGATEGAISVTWYALGESEQKLQITESSNVENGEFPAANYKEYEAEAAAINYESYYRNSVELKGLKEGVSYSYRVSGTDTDGNTVWSDIYTYSPENLEDGFKFLVVGDPQIGTGEVTSDTEGWQLTMQTAVKQNPDVSFILSAGDQIDAYSAGNTLENQYYGFLSEDALLSSIPLASAVGNHDAGRGDEGAASYVNHYTLPNVSKYGSSDDSSEGEEDYYFTYDNALFMVLNTNNSSIAEHKQFIKNTLNNNEDCTWKIVVFHQSIYSVASHVNDGNIAELRTGLSPVFAENDIDVVLMGHDHVYARSYMMGGETGMEADIQKDAEGNALTEFMDPEGVQYVTLNSASGSKYYNITQELFEYTAVQNQEKTPNYSCAVVDEDSFTLTTYRTNDQSVVDTFTIYKSSQDDGDDTEDGDSENTDIENDDIENDDTEDDDSQDTDIENDDTENDDTENGDSENTDNENSDSGNDSESDGVDGGTTGSASGNTNSGNTVENDRTASDTTASDTTAGDTAGSASVNNDEKTDSEDSAENSESDSTDDQEVTSEETDLPETGDHLPSGLLIGIVALAILILGIGLRKKSDVTI